MPPIHLPELEELDELAQRAGAWMQTRVLCEVEAEGRTLPVHAFLRSVVMRPEWDVTLHRMLEGMRLLFVPLVNPGGVALGTRANPNGVDLMRNAPVDSTERVPHLIGGQRISRSLPWYRGAAGGEMECESAAVCRIVTSELLGRAFSMTVDCHSGFGLVDRIWFPFAHSARPIPHLAELQACGEILNQGFLHHRYVLEPQSRQYLAHGDIWDYLCLDAIDRRPATVFLPLTLEMGSWIWIRKNPRQLFSRGGIFNPMIEHRQQRVLRRHIALLDFIARAVCSHERWRPSIGARPGYTDGAMVRWFGQATR